MRSNVPDYALITPSDVADALHLLEKGGWRPFGGGTDIMVLFEAGKLEHRKFFTISHLADLHGVEERDDMIYLGAMNTYTELQESSKVQRAFPMLCQAARQTGSIATQNRGTLAGNIVNASPAADSPPALLCYDAEVQLVSVGAVRWVPYDQFHTGYKQMVLQPNELLCTLRMPRPAKGWRDYYRKVGTRRAQAISKVCFAGRIWVEGDVVRDIRIALGSVAPVPLRCRVTETMLRGQHLSAGCVEAAKKELAREIAPIDDMRSTAYYRTRVAQNLLGEFLAHAKPN